MDLCARGAFARIVVKVENSRNAQNGLGEVRESAVGTGARGSVEARDLLPSKRVLLHQDRIRTCIAGKVILVTGAGGSIGSELCCQIAQFHPAAIVALDVAETPLFEIDRRIRQMFPGLPFHAEIGDIRNSRRVDEVFADYRPAAAYHAAAYKHVPLMEKHIFEAVENNVIGTQNVAQAAIRSRAESFVLISSDKAIAPANVMGVTKRLSEQLVLGLASDVKFIAVRFGNVVGSSGSVVPIFEEQIKAGGPVTVTHPDMRRYFMTVAEACQLVLEAAAIADGGQVCILDMGEPVKIVDLATKMIESRGLTPGKDIEIRFTGIRDGEKLSEDLTSELEQTLPSAHERIHIYAQTAGSDPDEKAWLNELEMNCRVRDAQRLLAALCRIVPDFKPTEELVARCSPRSGLGNALDPWSKA